jgi:hypothetical protein
VADGRPAALASLLAVGVSHRSAPAALRDAVFVPEAELDALHAALRDAGNAPANEL